MSTGKPEVADEGRAGRPGAGDDPYHGVCLGEDQEAPGERETATRTRVRGPAAW